MRKGLRRPQHRRRRGRSLARLLAGFITVVGITAGAWAILRPPAARARPGRPHSSTTSASPTSALPEPQTFSGPAGVEATWVVAENRRQGTTAWEISGTPPGVIAGFASRTSAQVGDTVALFVTTDAPTFHVEAYRMGYYAGAGARLVWASPELPGRTQPPCPVVPMINMVACDNWTPSLHLMVTSAFVQGDYLLKLVGSGGQASYIPLTVWDPASNATYLAENDVYTWQAWNPYGGYDFYVGRGPCPVGAPTYPTCNRARVVSFDRPYGYGEGAGDFLGNEYPFVRFAEQHGLDITYATSDDFEKDPTFVARHKALLSLGHDECWSLTERQAAQAAEANGVNIVFFGASPILRHIRLQSSPLGPDREEVDYRDATADPLDGIGDPLRVTGNTWSAPPASWSEVPFVGESYAGYVKPGASPVAFVVTNASAWLYRGTGLGDGTAIPGLLLGDFDQFYPGLSPANLQIMAHSPMPEDEVQTNTANPASDTTYYSDPASGAGVFDTGTTAWISDLATHPIVAQMTANLLDLFGQGPAGRAQPSIPNWRRYYP